MFCATDINCDIYAHQFIIVSSIAFSLLTCIEKQGALSPSFCFLSTLYIIVTQVTLHNPYEKGTFPVCTDCLSVSECRLRGVASYLYVAFRL